MTYRAELLQIHPSRRHRDPSTLWITVLAGSLAIHLFLLLALRAYWSSIKVESQYAEIAVEFVEAPPTDALPASPTIASAPTEQTINEPLVPNPTAPAPAPETAEVPVSTTAPLVEPENAPVLTDPDPTAIAPSSQPAPQPQPSSQVQPPEPQSQSRNPAPVAQPSTPSTIPPTANPVPPWRPNPEASVPPTTPPVPSNGPISSGRILPPVPDISSEIDPTTQPTTAATDPSSSTIPSAPAPGQGTGLKLAAGAPVRVNTQKDVLTTQQGVPDQEATLLADRPSDETAVYPPAVGLNLGKPVKLWLLVSQQGKAERVEVRQSSGIPEYDEWAKQLGQQLQFQPALQAGQAISSEIEIEVSLEAL
ncbi:TonB family protein [Pantanalinema sp. GBBB05]|uniref:TonB family protein n=1 Tax=Pantanalinema sp. GBBB05 TaxID=2604139 RepID=UPI001E10EBDB|nr:TonB family protein [Pantanalinema sp. GBBB05]